MDALTAMAVLYRECSEHAALLEEAFGLPLTVVAERIIDGRIRRQARDRTRCCRAKKRSAADRQADAFEDLVGVVAEAAKKAKPKPRAKAKRKRKAA